MIQIASRVDENFTAAQVPSYIEIANLQVQDGYNTYNFTAENGAAGTYNGFAACIYARSVQHLVIRNNVLTNCGQGFYNWTGPGPTNNWWEGLQLDTVIRGNYFYNNGRVNSYGEHQSYTESNGVIYEFNRFGPMRPGSQGSQLKDRSAGTVIRHNYIHNAEGGWMLDLVEPENGWDGMNKGWYAQTFVYGNTLWSPSGVKNLIHWNEDHGLRRGRADQANGRLFFYNNTVSVAADFVGEWHYHALFNTTYGSYECAPGALPGVIDFRNNILVSAPVTPGAQPAPLRLAYCSNTNLNSGVNWITAGWVANSTAVVTGTTNLFSTGNPGFTNSAVGDFHLSSTSEVVSKGGALASQVTTNALGLNLTPTAQYKFHLLYEARVSSGAGSDLGAFAYSSGGLTGGPSAPLNVRIVQ